MDFGKVFQLSPFWSVGDWDGKLGFLGRHIPREGDGKTGL